MTLCIAALADDRKSIVMAADRMISLPMIESELDISKILPLQDDWWAMIAANSLPNVFPVIDRVTDGWEKSTGTSITNVVQKVTDAYRNERRARAQQTILEPRGLDLKSFLEKGKEWLPEISFLQISDSLNRYDLGVSLLDLWL